MSTSSPGFAEDTDQKAILPISSLLSLTTSSARASKLFEFGSDKSKLSNALLCSPLGLQIVDEEDEDGDDEEGDRIEENSVFTDDVEEEEEEGGDGGEEEEEEEEDEETGL